jgi:putative transposase
LDRVYPVVFIDAIHVKVRDGQVANRAFYCAIGVTVDGQRDILGVWPSPSGEGAKFWLNVLTELKNRGVADVCIVVCDGLKGLPDAIGIVWPLAIVQTCVLHLIRGSLPLRWPPALGCHGPRHAADPHRRERGASQGTVRRVLRTVGRPLPDSGPAVGERLSSCPSWTTRPRSAG